MEVSRNYGYSKTDYVERVKEKQAAPRTENAEEKVSEKWEKPQDEYISSEKSGQKPTGLYRVEQDEYGSLKIIFEDPKAVHANGKERKTGGSSPAKPAEEWIGNTDRVEREIRKLKEKKQQLEQQIRSVSEDSKIRELEKKLAQVEQELSQKDNDTYRRQNTSIQRKEN